MKKQLLNFETAKSIIRCIILMAEIHDLWFAIEHENKNTYVVAYDDNVEMQIEKFKISKRTAKKLKETFPQYIF